MPLLREPPATEIKQSLDLNFVPYPKCSGHNDAKGWVFAILARMLEDGDAVEYRMVSKRAFYRTVKR